MPNAELMQCGKTQKILYHTIRNVKSNAKTFVNYMNYG